MCVYGLRPSLSSPPFPALFNSLVAGEGARLLEEAVVVDRAPVKHATAEVLEPRVGEGEGEEHLLCRGGDRREDATDASLFGLLRWRYSPRGLAGWTGVGTGPARTCSGGGGSERKAARMLRARSFESGSCWLGAGREKERERGAG